MIGDQGPDLARPAGFEPATDGLEDQAERAADLPRPSLTSLDT
jgi:hypothetical protein